MEMVARLVARYRYLPHGRGRMGTGFQNLTPEQRSVEGRKGGKAAQASGRAHRWSKSEALVAGKKGGAAVVAKYGRERMAELGKLSRAANSGDE